jgi:HK97 family phage prohead protease
VTASLFIDQTGLRYTCDPPDTQMTRHVLESIRSGNVTGSSFSFLVTDVTWAEEGDLAVREIRGVELFDVGPVTFPAYSGTTAQVRKQNLFGSDHRRLRRLSRDAVMARARTVEMSMNN